jgi:hypothetical protein
MPVMCETCKCSIYLIDGTRDYGGCESGCPCCNEDIGGKLQERISRILELTPEKRAEFDEDDELADSNPILHAESAPNRFATMSLFFTDSDGVQIQEDLDLSDITVKYFTDDNDLPVTEGPFYDWAVNYYRSNY